MRVSGGNECGSWEEEDEEEAGGALGWDGQGMVLLKVGWC